MKKSLGILFLCTVLFLSGCTGMSKQDVGVVTGGALGGLLGSQFGRGPGRIVATIGGTLIGAFVGGSIGHSMDEVDRMRMQQELPQALDTGRTVGWRNTNSGDSYRIRPHRRHGRCRTYTVEAYIGGRKRLVDGRACLVNGRWVAQSN